MKFLDPELFYPQFDKRFDYKSWDNQMDIALKEYEKFFKKSKRKIDKRILELYEVTDRFHDFKFEKIIFHANKSFSMKEELDIVELLICDYQKSITLLLKDIVGFTLNMNQLGYKEKDRNGLEDIVLCEIGFENNCSFINFYMISGTEISINFRQAEYTIKELNFKRDNGEE